MFTRASDKSDNSFFLTKKLVEMVGNPELVRTAFAGSRAGAVLVMVNS